MWQQLLDSIGAEKFIVVAVAEESRGAVSARPWIEQASPTYPCLIDEDHRLAALYGMVNVPQCVWIDEHGKIVRGPEATGSTDHFRQMDLTTRTMAPDLTAARNTARQSYMDAVREWVSTGRYALPEDKARTALPVVTPDMALADAHFRLGVWLHKHGDPNQAKTHFAEASRLHPDSWNMWRQAADLQAVGNASGPAFWDRVKALGDRPYYHPPILE